jgi:hypothetical protein
MNSKETHSSGSQWNASRIQLIRVNHAEFIGQMTRSVINYRKRKRSACIQMAICLNILDPIFVHLHVIARQSEQFDVSLFELVLELSCASQLGRANRREIVWMREQNAPASNKNEFCMVLK